MKVLHVVASMDPRGGGVSEAIRNIVVGLEKKSIESAIVTLDRPDAEFLTAIPVPVYGMGPSKTSWQYSPRLSPWLMTHLADFDVVMVHGLWLYTSYAVYKAVHKTKKSIKVFVMSHGMLDPYFQKAEGRRIKAIRNYFFWKLIERHLINSANGLLFTSRQELILARQSFRPYHPKEEINIGYGILEPPKYMPSMTASLEKICPAIKGQQYILYMGRINPKKNVEALVSVYLKQKEKLPALPKLLIAGPGMKTEYGEKVIQLAKDSDDILLCGMLKGDAKWGALYGCDAFILPSHQENFGIAVVEALACSKPVLISFSINIWKEIADSKAGLIAADTEAGITDLLQRWNELSVSQITMMHGTARQAYATYFEIEKTIDRLINVFLSLPIDSDCKN